MKMKIKINGKEEIIDNDKISVNELLKTNDVENPDTVSVQVNGEFVDKKAYEGTILKEDDAIDFLYFMGGGTILKL